VVGLSVEQYLGQLDAQLERESVKKAVADLRKAHPVFAKYPAIEDLIDLGRPGIRNYEDVDAVLAILLAELKRETTLFPLLNLLFWKSLVRLFYSKKRSVPDEDEDDLFIRIQTEFFHVAASYPLDRRPRKIDVNLILDTKKKVTRWQREEALYHEQHEEWDPAHEECVQPHEERPSLADLQVSDIFPEEMEIYLLSLVYRKVINERQYDLLLETQVYGRRTQKAWAEDRGFTYATVRSWHFRAEAAIRKYEKARREHEQEGQ
jgi:hypothetical protein